MLLDLNTFIALSFFIIFLCILLLAITISYFRTSKKLSELEEEKQNLYEKTRDEEDKMLEHAQIEFQDTIKHAEEQAKSIIDEAGKISSDTNSDLNLAVSSLSKREEEILQKKSDEFVSEYQKQLQRLNQDSINMFKNVSKDVLSSIEQHFSELKKIMEEQTVGSRKIADEKIKSEYDSLEKELAEYKVKELEKIDHNIYEILLNISKIAFGKGISIEDHEKLISEALSEVKKN